MASTYSSKDFNEDELQRDGKEVAPPDEVTHAIMFTAKETKIVENAVKETLQEMKKYYPDDYAKLLNNSAKLQSIKDAAREVAQEQVTLAKEFTGEVCNIRARLAKHLPESRIMLLEKGLEIPTFRMNIHKQEDGKHLVEIKTDKGDLYPPKVLMTLDDIDESKIMQYASIVVEGVMLVISAVGIPISAGEGAIEKAVQETADVIKSSTKFERAIEAFADEWDAAGGSPYKMAKALFKLIKDTYSANILWNIIKTVCVNMKWYEWLETAAKVSAMIIAAFATEGAALIAEIALVVMSAAGFMRKLVNLKQLDQISASLM